MNLLTVFVTHLGAYLAFFGFLDAVLEKRTKESVSWYIFGYQGNTFPRMELALVQGLVGFLIRKSFFSSFLRFWIISALIMLLIVVSALVLIETSPVKSELTSGPIQAAIMAMKILTAIAALSLCSTPMDYISARITHRIFGVREVSLATFPIWIVVDIILSVMTLLLALIALAVSASALGISNLQNEGQYFSDYLTPHGVVQVVGIGIFFSGFSVFYITAIQLSSFILGIFLRGLSALLRLNQWIALHSKLHSFPFTFLGIFTGLISFLIGNLS